VAMLLGQTSPWVLHRNRCGRFHQAAATACVCKRSNILAAGRHWIGGTEQKLPMAPSMPGGLFGVAARRGGEVLWRDCASLFQPDEKPRDKKRNRSQGTVPIFAVYRENGDCPPLAAKGTGTFFALKGGKMSQSQPVNGYQKTSHDALIVVIHSSGAPASSQRTSNFSRA